MIIFKLKTLTSRDVLEFLEVILHEYSEYKSKLPEDVTCDDYDLHILYGSVKSSAKVIDTAKEPDIYITCSIFSAEASLFKFYKQPESNNYSGKGKLADYINKCPVEIYANYLEIDETNLATVRKSISKYFSQHLHEEYQTFLYSAIHSSVYNLSKLKSAELHSFLEQTGVHFHNIHSSYHYLNLVGSVLIKKHNYKDKGFNPLSYKLFNIYDFRPELTYYVCPYESEYTNKFLTI